MSEGTVTEIRPHEQALLVFIQRTSLDEMSTRTLVDDVLDAAAEKPHVPIVLDLSRVRFAPSGSLGLLVQLSKGFKLDGRRIAMIGFHKQVLETIRVTRLDAVLEIHDTLEQVLGSAPKAT